MRVSAVEDKTGKQTKGSWNRPVDKMDAIAYGVEARHELIIGYTRNVIEETIAIARKLGVPEHEIKKWSSSRSIHDKERIRIIESTFKRVQGFLGEANS